MTMTFGLLSLALAALASAWATQPLWRAGRGTHDGLDSIAFPLSGRGARPPLRTGRSYLIASLPALFIIGLAGAGYAWLGSTDDLQVGPRTALTPRQAPIGIPAPTTAATASTMTAASTAAADAAQARTRVTTLVARLAERLKSDPDDADGWDLLGRSYVKLGQHAPAIAAFRNAVRLRPDDATLLTALAFSVAVIEPDDAGGGEPMRLVERALALEPKNPRALALAGTLALDRGRYTAAADYWERLARVEPPDSPIGRQIQTSIAQVRERAAMQNAAATAAQRTTTAATGPLAAISGIVSLAPALRGRVDAADTVFVIARPVDGSRMPLAVLRRQVKDLPLRFTLDDSLAMAANAKLSGASRVDVIARISKSGNAIAHEGDLQGTAISVAVGSKELKIEIGEVVKGR